MPAARLKVLLVLYALTLFQSASLLFTVQPLVGKLIVPLLGGLPAVWNTCMVFFQAMLLLGYLYAHLSTRWLGQRRQALLHLGLLLLPALVLPLEVPRDLDWVSDTSPIRSVLTLLTVSVGLPFFLVSVTAPLLQSWLADTDSPAALDPYFLYAASNVGSMLALLSYPVLIEPNLSLVSQRYAWTWGYGLLVLLTAGCALLLWRSPRPASSNEAATPEHPATAQITTGRALRWVALAFVPSSLLLSVTTHNTTDIAPIPLLWVLPLSLYLLTFILVFSRLPAWVHRLMVHALRPALLLGALFLLTDLWIWMSAKVLIHLGVLFVVAMVCHGELARDRPAAGSLTNFYLLMSLGGVLGGMFNALLAPVLFNTLAEYPIGLVLAGLLMPAGAKNPTRAPSFASRAFEFLMPVLIGLVALEFLSRFPVSHYVLPWGWITEIADQVSWGTNRFEAWFGLTIPLKTLLIFGTPLLICYALARRPLHFGVGLAGILLIGQVRSLSDPSVIYRGRSFFGALRVKHQPPIYPGEWDPTFSDLCRYLFSPRVAVSEEGPTSGFTMLYHGSTLHGVQDRSPKLRDVPVYYYAPTGPVGQVFDAFEGEQAKRDLAVVGLGAGTMACYAKGPGYRVTFYEIDPLVQWLSYDQRKYFSFVQDAQDRGAQVDIVLGDGRLQLDRERSTQPDRKYDLIFVAAFSSDSVPVHLITREALEIYLDKVKANGMIAFIVSNRYLRLEPVLANLAYACGARAYIQSDEDATWVLVARKEADLGRMAQDSRWKQLALYPAVGVWTDDFSNLLKVFEWKGE